VDPDPGSGIFLTLESVIRDEKFGSGINTANKFIKSYPSQKIFRIRIQMGQQILIGNPDPGRPKLSPTKGINEEIFMF
jgi:hypothetical protein